MTTFQRAAAPVAAALALALAPSPARADAAIDCLQKFFSANSALNPVLSPSRGADAASLGEALKRADERMAAALACADDPAVKASTKHYPKIEKQKDKFAKRRAEAAAFVKRVAESEALAGEAKTLLAKIRKSDGTDFDALMAEAEALDEKIKAAIARNDQVSRDWHQRTFFQIGKALQEARNRATRAQIAADEARLRAGAVTARLPKYTPEDAFVPAKVAAAFREMDPNDYVVTIPLKDTSRHHWYEPGKSNHYHLSFEDTFEPGEVPERPAVVRNNDVAVFPRYLKHLPDPPPHTPGLIWNVLPEGWVVFVAFDGGRYRSHLGALMNAVTRPELWPKAPIHTTLLDDDVAFLAEKGVLPARTANAMVKASEQWSRCAKKLWKAHDAQFDAIETANILPHVRDERTRRLNEKVRGLIAKRCRAHRKAYERAWHRANDEYAAIRRQAFEQMRDHLLALVRKATAPE